MAVLLFGGMRVLSLQHGLPPHRPDSRISRLNGPTVERVGNYLEDKLGRCITFAAQIGVLPGPLRHSTCVLSG
jgi:hypothetical protein